MTGIHSKAATKEYRDNWDRIFAKKKEHKSCPKCAVDGQTCECDEAVCHVPDSATDCAKELDYSSEEMMPTEDGNK